MLVLFFELLFVLLFEVAVASPKRPARTTYIQYKTQPESTDRQYHNIMYHNLLSRYGVSHQIYIHTLEVTDYNFICHSDWSVDTANTLLLFIFLIITQ